MIVFRLSKSEYSRDLSGKGAELSGGRWNNKGNALIYTSESRALCTTEIAVHLPLGIVPSDYELISIQIPDELIFTYDAKELPKGWNGFPHSEETQKIGDAFLAEGAHLAMKVPSAVIQDENNFIINPKHPKMKKVKIVSVESFLFDSRLFHNGR